MQMKEIAQDLIETSSFAEQLQTWLISTLVLAAGILFALNVLPIVLPGLSTSVSGESPKVFWYLSRGSAMAAYWVLWLAMAMGVVLTNRMAQIWPGVPPAYEVHQYTSLFGMSLALFHALILTGDRYIAYTIPQVLIPFASQNYRPIWVGVGQTALYVWLLVNLSFYVRKRIGKQAWHWIHFASYASFLGAMAHAIFSGTDSTLPLTQALYWISGGSLLFLTVYRILIALFPAAVKRSQHKLEIKA